MWSTKSDTLRCCPEQQDTVLQSEYFAQYWNFPSFIQQLHFGIPVGIPFWNPLGYYFQSGNLIIESREYFFFYVPVLPFVKTFLFFCFQLKSAKTRKVNNILKVERNRWPLRTKSFFFFFFTFRRLENIYLILCLFQYLILPFWLRIFFRHKEFNVSFCKEEPKWI